MYVPPGLIFIIYIFFPQNAFVFCMDFQQRPTTSLHSITFFCNREGMLLLGGMKRIFEYN